MDLSWAAELFYRNINTFGVINLLQGCKSGKSAAVFFSYLDSMAAVEVPASQHAEMLKNVGTHELQEEILLSYKQE